MKTGKFGDYITLASLAFLGLGMEVILNMFEKYILRFDNNYGVDENIIHWILTCIVWGAFAFLLIRSSKKTYGFDVNILGEKMSSKQFIGVIICFIIIATTSFIELGQPKIVKEFQNQHFIEFVFQNIYYFIEVILVTLIIVFGQKAFEIKSNNNYIPYGGIVLALTWGLVHTLTQGDIKIGITVAFMSIIFGVIYLLLNKDFKKTVVTIFILFII